MFENIKDLFPVFKKNPNLIFLDTAASALKPKNVIEIISNCYSYEYANIHRGIYNLSSELTLKYENVRSKTSNYINSENSENIIFTKNATEGINLVASCFSKKFLKKDDEIIISYLEHHANIVPWQLASEKYGFKIVAIDINKDEGSLNLDDLKNKINSRTKLISLTHMSNVTGAITDFEFISNISKKNNIPILIDGCQFVAHSPVDVKSLDCDFYVFSGHKLYGPSGVGVLYMKNKWFDLFDPYQGGGQMISDVDIEKTTYANGYQKFEAGTPPIVQVIGLGASYDFISNYNLQEIFKYEKELYSYAVDIIKSINEVKVIGESKNKGAILTFTIKDIHSSDISMVLDQHNVAIRSGHHCAIPFHKKLKLDSTSRASFGIYNDKKDVNAFIDGVKEVIKFFKK